MQFASRQIRAKWRKNPKFLVGTWAIYHQSRWANGTLYQSSVVECVHADAKRALFVTLDTRHMAEHFWISLRTALDPDSRLSYLGQRSRLMWLGVGNIVIRPDQTIGNGRFNQVVSFGHTIEIAETDNFDSHQLATFEISDALHSLRRPSPQERRDGPIPELEVWGSTVEPEKALPEATEIVRMTAWEMIDETV